jgi:hypothetical protein
MSAVEPQEKRLAEAVADTVMDLCLRHALAIEEQFGFVILTRVKVAEAADARA